MPSERMISCPATEEVCTHDLSEFMVMVFVIPLFSYCQVPKNGFVVEQAEKANSIAETTSTAAKNFVFFIKTPFFRLEKILFLIISLKKAIKQVRAKSVCLT